MVAIVVRVHLEEECAEEVVIPRCARVVVTLCRSLSELRYRSACDGRRRAILAVGQGKVVGQPLADALKWPAVRTADTCCESPVALGVCEFKEDAIPSFAQPDP